MKSKILGILAIMVLVASLVAAAPASSAKSNSSLMPANPEKILQSLIKQGKISATTPKDQQEAAVYNYLQQKTKGGSIDQPNPLAKKLLEANEEAMNLQTGSTIRGKKLGNTLDVPASTPGFRALEGTDTLLLIAVEFSNTPYTWTPVGGEERTAFGPLHNEIPVPDNSFDLYVPDFDTQHYEDMLFTPGGWTIPLDAPRYAGEHRGSMADYFLEQSYGKYSVEGDAFGWFTVDKPEAYYGDDDPFGGNDNYAPGDTSTLIKDAVAVVNSENAITWADYDVMDLYDLDNDGDLNEPDCIIDHPLFIHAGIDQSGGGGAQGDDAIWAHSSSVTQKVAVSTCSNGVFPAGLWIYNYTIMPEDGGVGVFAHEFGHDLGLPDEYDTIYSGRGDDVAFWGLMSSGSWIGLPAQTQPSDMSIWGRYALGWLVAGDNLAVVTLDDLKSQGKTPLNLRLEQAERSGGDDTINAVRVSLPQKLFAINTPHSGSYEWWGGKANLLDTTLARTVDLTGKTSASLSFWTWYDTEEFWDFGFVQVSTDGGATWTSLPIAGTTSDIYPDGADNIKANLPGFTGSSGGWLSKTADLSAYAGQNIKLQFRYMTDAYTTNAGFFVDDISVTADGVALFTDDAETTDPAWTATGWSRTTASSLYTHYYMMEWRNLNAMETDYASTSIVNFDNGLTNAYSFDPYTSGNPNEPWYFSYNPGMLLWYRDFSYTDNWTGAHPGHGFLLVVDAHPQAMMRAPYLNASWKVGGGVLPWNSRIQTYDSTFSLQKAYDAVLSYWGVVRKYAGLGAVPTFDDGLKYWDPKAPAASVITPKYGLLFRVLGQATDGSAAVIGLGLK